MNIKKTLMAVLLVLLLSSCQDYMVFQQFIYDSTLAKADILYSVCLPEEFAGTVTKNTACFTFFSKERVFIKTANHLFDLFPKKPIKYSFKKIADKQGQDNLLSFIEDIQKNQAGLEIAKYISCKAKMFSLSKKRFLVVNYPEKSRSLFQEEGKEGFSISKTEDLQQENCFSEDRLEKTSYYWSIKKALRKYYFYIATRYSSMEDLLTKAESIDDYPLYKEYYIPLKNYSYQSLERLYKLKPLRNWPDFIPLKWETYFYSFFGALERPVYYEKNSPYMPEIKDQLVFSYQRMIYGDSFTSSVIYNAEKYGQTLWLLRGREEPGYWAGILEERDLDRPNEVQRVVHLSYLGLAEPPFDMYLDPPYIWLLVARLDEKAAEKDGFSKLDNEAKWKYYFKHREFYLEKILPLVD